MISRTHLSVILLLSSLIWVVLLIIDGVSVSIYWLRHISTVVAIVIFMLSLFNLWIWRLPLLHGWFVKRPDIHGTWYTIIQSNWVNPDTGKTIEPIFGYMVVHQTFSTLSLRLITKESTSRLSGVEIVRFPDNTYQIVGVYHNEPLLSVRSRSPIHNGAILLQVLGTPVTKLKGHYWTDRNTAGEIELTHRHGKLFHDFETAHTTFTSQSTD